MKLLIMVIECYSSTLLAFKPRRNYGFLLMVNKDSSTIFNGYIAYFSLPIDISANEHIMLYIINYDAIVIIKRKIL